MGKIIIAGRFFVVGDTVLSTYAAKLMEKV
jgi:hypothetical protein